MTIFSVLQCFRDTSKVTQSICRRPCTEPKVKVNRDPRLAFSTVVHSSLTHTTVIYLTDKLKGHGECGIKSTLNCNLYDILRTELFLNLVLFLERVGVDMAGANKADDGCKQPNG